MTPEVGAISITHVTNVHELENEQNFYLFHGSVAPEKHKI